MLVKPQIGIEIATDTLRWASLCHVPNFGLTMTYSRFPSLEICHASQRFCILWSSRIVQTFDMYATDRPPRGVGERERERERDNEHTSWMAGP